jgi:hypothetical protein
MTAYCQATLTYNIPNSDGTDNYRTATCGLQKSDDGTEHLNGGTTHDGGGKTWDAPIDSQTTEKE